MSHARIEEVSDSDSDPSEGAISDLDDFDERDILKVRPSQITAPTLTSLPSSSSKQLLDPSELPSAQQQRPQSITAHDGTQFQSTTDDSKYKDFQCIYPVYFDKNRSRAQGRRVGRENAVENPLAREIVAACGMLRLETLFEPAKLHPKDWSNPGRVKVKVKGANNPLVNNKHHLYILIAKHLKENPTTEASAMRVRVPGAPVPDASKPYPRPAIPRGWKMGSILPYYSPAMTGGGVSEDFFNDMMKEMQGQVGPGGAPGGALEGMAAAAAAAGGGSGNGGGGGGGGGGKKKEKKKIKA